jgi:hypothetical protein
MTSTLRARTPKLTAVGTRCADQATLIYPQNLALASSTSGDRSGGIKVIELFIRNNSRQTSRGFFGFHRNAVQRSVCTDRRESYAGRRVKLLLVTLMRDRLNGLEAAGPAVLRGGGC